MATQLFANNASSLIAANITDTDTGAIIQTQTGYGALFPNPGAGEYYLVSIEDASGNKEIFRVSSRTGDLMTVTTLADRGLEGTTAQNWTSGNARVELRLTKDTMDGLLQKSGGTMTGDLDCDLNEVIDARLTGDTVVVGGQLVGTALRGTEDSAVNEVVAPNDGSRATAGGERIMTQNDEIMSFFPIGTVVLWHGNIGDIPTGWALCNGAGGTPDLRDKFVIGAGGAKTVGQVSAAIDGTGTTASSGGHTHTTDPTILTEANFAEHKHLSGVMVRARSGTWSGTDSFGQNPPWGGVLKGTAPLTYNENIWEHHQLRSDTTIGMPYTEPYGEASPTGHTHTVPSGGAHTHTVTTTGAVPANVALYYIKKVT